MAPKKLPSEGTTTSTTTSTRVSAARTGGERERERVASEETMDGRERLRRHRAAVAGRVWVPEIWGQEGFLKDWMDCATFDAAGLVGHRQIVTARAALVDEARQFHRLRDLQCNRS